MCPNSVPRDHPLTCPHLVSLDRTESHDTVSCKGSLEFEDPAKKQTWLRSEQAHCPPEHSWGSIGREVEEDGWGDGMGEW